MDGFRRQLRMLYGYAGLDKVDIFADCCGGVETLCNSLPCMWWVYCISAMGVCFILLISRLLLEICITSLTWACPVLTFISNMFMSIPSWLFVPSSLLSFLLDPEKTTTPFDQVAYHLARIVGFIIVCVLAIFAWYRTHMPLSTECYIDTHDRNFTSVVKWLSRPEAMESAVSIVSVREPGLPFGPVYNDHSDILGHSRQTSERSLPVSSAQNASTNGTGSSVDVVIFPGRHASTEPDHPRDNQTSISIHNGASTTIPTAPDASGNPSNHLSMSAEPGISTGVQAGSNNTSTGSHHSNETDNHEGGGVRLDPNDPHLRAPHRAPAVNSTTSGTCSASNSLPGASISSHHPQDTVRSTTCTPQRSPA